MLAATLASCGGSNSDASADAPATTPTASITLAGVVSTGAGSAGGTTPVAAKCAVGSGGVTTNADGSYRLTAAAANLPCVLEARTADGNTLHSVAPGTATDTTATANITPFTELLVANLAGANTSSYYAGFGSAAAAAVTATSVGNAAAAIAPVLASAGVNTGTLGNVLTAPLDGTYTTAITTFDTALTTGGVTLATVSDSTATNSVNGSAGGSAVFLPADLLLKPQASNCAALRSGSYRWILYGPSASTGELDPVTTTEVVNFNAQTLTVTFANSSTSTWTANGACRYTAAGGAEIVVSPAGVVVARTPQTVAGATTLRLATMFAEQSNPLSALAGTFNSIFSYESEGSTFTLDAAGTVVSARCAGEPLSVAASACVGDTTLLPRISANSAGGFDVTGTDPSEAYRDRLFTYRAGNGNLLLVFILPDGDSEVATRDVAQVLPAVGTSSSIWNIETTEISTNDSGVASTAIFSRAHTITSVDASAGRFTRNSTTVGTNNTHPQTFAINTGRNGYNRRQPATETGADGSTVNVREMYMLPLHGMGLTAYYLPNTSATTTSNATFGVSITQP